MDGGTSLVIIVALISSLVTVYAQGMLNNLVSLYLNQKSKTSIYLMIKRGKPEIGEETPCD